MKQIFLFTFLFTFNYCNAQTDQTYEKDLPPRIVPFEKFIRINISGQWKDQNSITSFFTNGSYLIKYDNGSEEIGSWKLESKKLILSVNGTSIEEVYNILDFTGITMKIQLVNGSDSTIWVSKKLKSKF